MKQEDTIQKAVMKIFCHTASVPEGQVRTVSCGEHWEGNDLCGAKPSPLQGHVTLLAKYNVLYFTQKQARVYTGSAG
jgi:hypothetical protein